MHVFVCRCEFLGGLKEFRILGVGAHVEFRVPDGFPVDAPRSQFACGGRGVLEPGSSVDPVAGESHECSIYPLHARERKPTTAHSSHLPILRAIRSAPHRPLTHMLPAYLRSLLVERTRGLINPNPTLGPFSFARRRRAREGRGDQCQVCAKRSCPLPLPAPSPHPPALALPFAPPYPERRPQASSVPYRDPSSAACRDGTPQAQSRPL